ncbi:MAG: RluA family pseudouridine synthase [Acidobacteria bacterium]|nr:RluA family pseudouridine synthase [Acidobacteriota bacterium]
MKLVPSASSAGQRLDHYLQRELADFSRSRIQEWIKAGRVRVDGGPARASMAVRAGQVIEVEPAAAPPPLRAFAEDLPVRFLYEDPAVVAVDKPAGMVVHVGAGTYSGTLVNALLHRFQSLSATGGPLRPGIVHRIDKDTSGVLLVARDDASHRALASQFAARTVEKTYLALVHGVVRQDWGHIRTPIERDPVRRTRMTTKTGRGRAAHTEFRVIRRFARHTYLEVDIHTGRTHQIRVHLASIGHPIAGDTLYGAPKCELGRQFLHAYRISFTSPASGQRVTVVSPLPPGLEHYLGGPL